MNSSENKNKKDKPLKPWSVFGALVLLNLLLGVVVFFFPSEGFFLGDNISLKFVSLTELLGKQEEVVVDIEQVLEDVNPIEEDTIVSIVVQVDTPIIETPRPKRKFSKWFSFPKNNPTIISSMIKRIKTQSKTDVVRILHYGDSQLEGDRITNYFRNQMQKRFGGVGPGILLPMEPTASARGNFLVTQSDNFLKHSIYTKSTVHDSFGMGGATFTVQHSGQIIDHVDTMTDSNFNHLIHDEVQNANSFINIKKRNMGFSRSREYSVVKLMYSSKFPFQLNLKDEDTVSACPIFLTDTFGIHRWQVNGDNEIELSWYHENSPYIYGVALDGETGVAVDNFPMRGSSGTGFSKMNQDLYSAQLKAMNVAAVILQYGVNIIPDVREDYTFYKRWMSSQLRSIRLADSSLSIIVIGPSDMSKNDGGNMVSYENIPLIRDAMKEAALENGCCFWDLYEAMGGQNAMSAWVEEGLAQKDYTHFTFRGARYVGEMLFKSIMELE